MTFNDKLQAYIQLTRFDKPVGIELLLWPTLWGVLFAAMGQAQQQGALDAALPPRVVLHILYARACDPAAGFLQDAGLYDNAEIVELVLRTSFDGLAARASAAEL